MSTGGFFWPNQFKQKNLMQVYLSSVELLHGNEIEQNLSQSRLCVTVKKYKIAVKCRAESA